MHWTFCNINYTTKKIKNLSQNTQSASNSTICCLVPTNERPRRKPSLKNERERSPTIHCLRLWRREWMLQSFNAIPEQVLIYHVLTSRCCTELLLWSILGTFAGVFVLVFAVLEICIALGFTFCTPHDTWRFPKPALSHGARLHLKHRESVVTAGYLARTVPKGAKSLHVWSMNESPLESLKLG